jgi:hypothetical protein
MKFEKLLLYILSLFFLTSCLNYHYTSEGGVRVENSKVFKYNKPKYTKLDKSKIDFNAIYILDSIYSKWDDTKGKKKYSSFIRFFKNGQVLISSFDSILTENQINNKNIGIPGYFIIKKDRIKIDMFQGINGGQTGKKFGKVAENGNLMFYFQRPETSFGSFRALEKDGRKSFWKKETKYKLIEYEPEW